MNFFKFALLILTVSAVVPKAFADSCDHMQLLTSKASVGNVVVQRDAPVGGILYTGTTTNADKYAWDCTGQQHLQFLMTYNGGVLSSYGNHVYNTNIPGLGIRFNSDANGTSGAYFENPASTQNVTSQTGMIQWWGGSLQFVKTGTIQSGELNAGELGRISILGHDGAYHDGLIFSFDSATIVSVACAITTPSLTFPIGTVPSQEFGSTVGFTPIESNTQNIGLNCDPDANINVQLNATQNPDVSVNSVLALNGQGDTGIASGVGVQLFYSGEPLEINKNILMKKSAGGQEMLPITAKYYQTKTAVTPGDASTSATLTLTYQ